eukprot:1839952-Pleurochrysis_carterae.AAC.1
MMSASTNTHALSRTGEAKRLDDCAAEATSGFSTRGELGLGRGDVAGVCGSADRVALAMSMSSARLTEGPPATAGRSGASEAALARWRALRQRFNGALSIVESRSLLCSQVRVALYDFSRDRADTSKIAADTRRLHRRRMIDQSRAGRRKP